MRDAQQAWLSRKDWRRLVALWLDGRIGRDELERMKVRLARARSGSRAASPLPSRAPPARPGGEGDGARDRRLRLVSRGVAPEPPGAPLPAALSPAGGAGERRAWDPLAALARARAAAARALRIAG